MITQGNPLIVNTVMGPVEQIKSLWVQSIKFLKQQV